MHAYAAAPAEARADLDQLMSDARAQLIADPRRALKVADQVVAGADARGDHAASAAARQVRGDALRFLGQHEAALQDYGLAGDLFRRLGRPGDAARTDASAVDSLRCLGRATDALKRAARARRVFRRLG